MKNEIKKIQVEIEGLTPLLMNSPKAMLEPEDIVKSKTKKRDPKKECEKVAYRTSKGKLYVPSAAIKGCIINAAAYKKTGKFSLRPFLAGGMRITPEEVIIDNQKYDIDLRTVVIQRSRVVKARPKIPKWKLNFTIEYDADLISDPKIIVECLEEGGRRIGILDFRPQKLGEFGQFKVNKWKVA